MMLRLEPFRYIKEKVKMAKTPWMTLAVALTLSLSLAACDGGSEEAPKPNAGETGDESTQQTQDSMTEAGDNTAEVTGQPSSADPAAGDPAAGDPAVSENGIDGSGGAGDSGADTEISADVDSDWESTEQDVDEALKEAERRFEEAEKELNEQFKAAEEKDVTKELEIDEPGQPAQQ